MEGLAGAASVIAVIDLSAKIASICVRYSLAVKHAKDDIDLFRREIDSITDLLEDVMRVLERPDHTQLLTSMKLKHALSSCSEQLLELSTTLDPGRRRKIMSSFGVRALKWPFKTSEVEKAIQNLERSKRAIALALQVDQTELILDIHQRLDPAKLPSVPGAAFNSHDNEHEAKCLPNTRTELLREIADWAEDGQGKCIFWLNGMAGTGKSTISRTVAQSFANNGQLGASFFFKRGEGDRGKVRWFFTTIAAQLAIKWPAIRPFIVKAIDEDPLISEKSLKDQFEKLVFLPLCRIPSISQHAPKLVFVVDALDECEREEDIAVVIQLLSQLRDLTSVYLRIFITSRPELPIRFGFGKMQGDTYNDLSLHEMPPATIEHDILVFLTHEFAKIREAKRLLDESWPSEDDIQTLLVMAVPLFIFAATLCRFVGEKGCNTRKRLDIILKAKTTRQVSNIDTMYLQVLNELIVEKDEVEKQNLAREFREVVGTIVVLVDPLSTIALASLLDIERDDVTCKLDLLHSVLNVPTREDQPVRLLHLSFRDFLLDSERSKNGFFWVDEKRTHKEIASQCLKLMSKSNCLKRDICNLRKPGTLRSEIDRQTVQDSLQEEVRYACRYWLYHVEQSNCGVEDNDQVHVFLQVYLLHWLEAMSLLGKTSESITMIISLLAICEADRCPKLHAFLDDARRFTLYNRSLIEQAPLQIYCSALLFVPNNSIIRRNFESDVPTWIQLKPKMQEDWDAARQTLEGHSSGVTSVAFSPDGKVVASASWDETVRLWDAATGAARQTLEGHSDWVTSVAFSPDGKVVASASADKTVRLWDAATGAARQTLEGHSDWVTSVVFSPDGKVVASASRDKTVRLWDAATGAARQTLEGHSDWVTSVAFSPDGKVVASASRDKTVRLWDAATGAARQTLEGHSGEVTSVAFSPDGKVVASASLDETVRLWDAATGAARQTLEGHSGGVTSVAFSPDGKVVASASRDETVRLWDAATGAARQTLEGHSGGVTSVAFSPDGKVVASASVDETVRLWDAATGAARQTLEGHSGRVTSVAFSPDGKVVASASVDETVRLWDAATGAARQTLEGHSGGVTSVAFSPDGKVVASASWDETVSLWDAATGAARQTLEGHSDWVTSVAFSPDGKVVASASLDKTVRLWDAATGAARQTLEGHSGGVTSVAFSPDGKVVASASADKTVRLWDAATGAARQTLEGHSGGVTSVAFSPDGKVVASASWDETVRLWDAATGAARQTLEGHSGQVTSVAFSKSGHFLKTDRGSLRIIPPDTSSSDDRDPADGFSVVEEWITRNEMGVLWLPPDYRAASVAVSEAVVVLGQRSGRVSTFQFAPGSELVL